MAERPSTCDPHVERETLLVCVYLLRALSFVGGCQGRNRLSENGGDPSRDQALFRWPPSSPDLTPCDLLLWGYVKDCVFLQHVHVLRDLPEVRRGIITVISEIDCDLLHRAKVAMDYRLDVCRVTKGGHLQHIWGMQKILGALLCPSVSRMLQSFPSLNCTDFMKCVGELWITLYYVLVRRVV
jgi:hypothetical protein